MEPPARCRCGHHEAVHWYFGQMKGCNQHRGLFDRCQCTGYRPISPQLEDALAELLHRVAECEHDWDLMDRIDVDLGIPTRRGDPRPPLGDEGRPR